MEKNKRLTAIDYTRALAIILVVAGHWQPDVIPGWWRSAVSLIYTFHMPLFLAMSGYLYMYTLGRHSYPRFLEGKVKRLLIPYVTTSVIVITIKLFSQSDGAYVQNPVGLSSYLEIFYLPAAGYYLWFIWALWWMFVITPLFRSRTARTLLFAATLLLAAAPFDLPEIFCLQQTKQMYVFFMFGVMLYDWKQRIPLNNRTASASTMALFILLLALHAGGLTIADPIIPYVSVYAIISAFAIAEARLRRSSLNALLTAIAAASYIIYLFHTTCEGFVKSLAMKFGLLSTNLSFALTAAAAIAAGTLLPLLLQRYVLNRFRLTAFLFGLPHRSEKP